MSLQEQIEDLAIKRNIARQKEISSKVARGDRIFFGDLRKQFDFQIEVLQKRLDSEPQITEQEENGIIEQKKTNPLLIPAIIIGALILS